MFVSYAQNFEDVILNRIFKDKESGFYIDVGAHHPVCDSVTKLFYDRGWSGINIEPVKEFYNLLQQQRSRDINLNIALGDSNSNLEFFELEGTGYSTLNGRLAKEFAREKGLHLFQYRVPVRSLTDVCREYAHCPIDFLKIDVEGWEEQVISGNDWDLFRPTVMLIEATIPDSPIRKDTNILSFLKEKSYDRIYFDGLNDYYLAREASNLVSCFNTPPNVFDNFIPFKVADLMTHVGNLERNNKIIENYLKDERFEVERLSGIIAKLQESKNESIRNYQQQILELQARLFEAKQAIEAMESSKFWKIRKAWFQFQKTVGIVRN